jgi:MSHA biogenesis protein MshP
MFRSSSPLGIKQTGSSLVIAIFVIVVMSALAAAIQSNISASVDQSVHEVLGTRALFAAETGNELALAQVFPVSGVAANCIASQQTYFSVAGLEQCVIATACSTQAYAGTDYYSISSTGTCKSKLAGDATDFSCSISDKVCVTRSIEVEAKAL